MGFNYVRPPGGSAASDCAECHVERTPFNTGAPDHASGHRAADEYGRQHIGLEVETIEE